MRGRTPWPDSWRARAHCESLGIQVTAVIVDYGSCYRSHAFKGPRAKT